MDKISKRLWLRPTVGRLPRWPELQLSQLGVPGLCHALLHERADNSLTEQPRQQSIELISKRLHVFLAERLWTRCIDACRTKLLHQIASG